MAYFHVDRTRAYVDSLGLSRALRGKPQKVRANGISADNSYYSPMTRSMTLGTGGVDDGEDADVIVHEYGHSLQDQAVQGFGARRRGGVDGRGVRRLPGGGDVGADHRRRPAVRPLHLRLGRRLLFRERVRSPGRQGARPGPGEAPLLGARSTAWARSGRAPCTSSAALLGADPQVRSVIDRVVLESHFMLGRRAKFSDGARALIAADELLYAGAHAAAIEAEMVERGLCGPGRDAEETWPAEPQGGEGSAGRSASQVANLRPAGVFTEGRPGGPCLVLGPSLALM